MSPDQTEIAERLKHYRRLAGLTQEDAARKLDVTVRTFARWERGESFGFLKDIDRIADAIDTTPERIIGDDRDSVPGSSIAAEVAALHDEIAELRQLLLDPKLLREASEALRRDEDVDGAS